MSVNSSVTVPDGSDLMPSVWRPESARRRAGDSSRLHGAWAATLPVHLVVILSVMETSDFLRNVPVLAGLSHELLERLPARRPGAAARGGVGACAKGRPGGAPSSSGGGRP